MEKNGKDICQFSSSKPHQVTCICLGHIPWPMNFVARPPKRQWNANSELKFADFECRFTNFSCSSNSEQDLVYRIFRFHQCLWMLWIFLHVFSSARREADPASLPGCSSWAGVTTRKGNKFQHISRISITDHVRKHPGDVRYISLSWRFTLRTYE
jgi:hypothetical protein